MWLLKCLFTYLDNIVGTVGCVDDVVVELSQTPEDDLRNARVTRGRQIS